MVGCGECVPRVGRDESEFDYAFKQSQDAPEIAGCSRSFSVSSVKHIRTQHRDTKIEASRGQIAVTENDIACIPDIVTSYDAVRSDLRTEQGAKRIAYAKRVGDGALVYIEGVSRKRQDLRGVTMWKLPKGADESRVLEYAVEGENSVGQNKGPAFSQEKSQDARPQDDALRPLSDYESDAQTPSSGRSLLSCEQELNQAARGTFSPSTNAMALPKGADLSTLRQRHGVGFRAARAARGLAALVKVWAVTLDEVVAVGYFGLA